MILHIFCLGHPGAVGDAALLLVHGVARLARLILLLSPRRRQVVEEVVQPVGLAFLLHLNLAVYLLVVLCGREFQVATKRLI